MKIIAYGITNLTDARYFAAMGADWIGFRMDKNSPLTIAHVKAFADWVEGPQFYLDVRGRTVDEIAGMLAEIEVDGLLTTHDAIPSNYAGNIITAFADHRGSEEAGDTVVYLQNEWLEVQEHNSNVVAVDIWVVIHKTEDLKALDASLDQISGCVVLGQDEDKVGVKSYENLDEIIDSIRG
jgi:2C-methyl-D-erythritol 2,4-cyclodiphosphate synthase